MTVVQFLFGVAFVQSLIITVVLVQADKWRNKFYIERMTRVSIEDQLDRQIRLAEPIRKARVLSEWRAKNPAAFDQEPRARAAADDADALIALVDRLEDSPVNTKMAP